MNHATLKPTYHPNSSRLLDYAAGSAAPPVELLVASHLTLCPECRRTVKELERLGGALLEEIAPEPIEDDALAHLFARIERGEGLTEAPRLSYDAAEAHIPRPLLQHAGGSLAQLSWRRFGPVAESRLFTERDDHTTRLLWVKAGHGIPRHVHAGQELTLVLSGGYSDADGRYLSGDVAERGPDKEHRPVADLGEDCLALVVADAPVRLSGPIGRLLSRFLKI